jgi:HlyD family secretion protein
MDRELDIRIRRRRSIKRIGLSGATLAAAGALWLWLPGLLVPSLHRSEFRTATVERGRVEAITLASGTVLPAFEKVLSSPDEARILRVLRRPGEAVEPGDEIVELDASATRLQLDRLIEQIAQKRNERRQLGLDLDEEVADLESRIDATALDEELLRYKLQQQRDLHADGLTSEAALRQAEVELRKVEVELAQLRQSVEAASLSNDARIDGLELDIRILEKERDETQHRLDLAAARSDRRGVVTWVPPEEGASVSRGTVIARIADLSSFRVEATVSDTYSERLAVGLPARVRVGERFLPGRISRVHPTIDDGVARFDVELDRPSDDGLRHNLRVEVLVVSDAREDALRVRKGPFALSGAAQQVFVVRGDDAWRTDATLGLRGYDHFEVVTGLDAGDEVIISSMDDHRHVRRVRIKQ